MVAYTEEKELYIHCSGRKHGLLLWKQVIFIVALMF